MDYETKLFDTTYLATRVNELKEIRNKTYVFKIEKSNRENSKSVYIKFFAEVAPEKYLEVSCLRISDHLLDNRTKVHYEVSYLVDENRVLDKKRKALFMRTLQNCISLAKKRLTNMAFNRVKKEGGANND